MAAVRHAFLIHGIDVRPYRDDDDYCPQSMDYGSDDDCWAFPISPHDRSVCSDWSYRNRPSDWPDCTDPMDLTAAGCTYANRYSEHAGSSSTGADCTCCCYCCWLLSTTADWWLAMESEYMTKSVKHCDDWMARGFVVVDGRVVVVLCYWHRWCLWFVILDCSADHAVLEWKIKPPVLQNGCQFFMLRIELTGIGILGDILVAVGWIFGALWFTLACLKWKVWKIEIKWSTKRQFFSVSC